MIDVCSPQGIRDIIETDDDDDDDDDDAATDLRKGRALPEPPQRASNANELCGFGAEPELRGLRSRSEERTAKRILERGRSYRRRVIL